MSLKFSQRYQKTRNLSGGRARLVRLASLWLVLSAGLAGCAGAEAPTAAAQPAASGVAAAAPAMAGDTPPRGLDAASAARASPSLGAAGAAGNAATPAPARARVFPPSSPEALQALADARDAMQKKQWTRLAALAPAASADPLLGSYAHYWLLRQEVQDPTLPVPTERLEQFMAVNRDDYLADRMRADWIVAAARAGDYATVNQLGPVVASNAQVDCSRLMARHMTGQRVEAAEAMRAFQPVSACWSLLDELVERDIVGWAQLEPLLRATLETSKTGNAQRIAALMFSASDMRSYAALMKSARSWLAAQQPPRTREQTALVALALSRLARGNDRDEAAAYIERTWAGAMPKSDMQWVWGQFGLIAALNVDAQAVKWYRRSGKAPMTDYNHAWEVRSELRQATPDWARVAKAIQKMSAEQQAEPVWVYWHGRAMAAQDRREAAARHFESIAGEYGFYGQLANEELGRSIPIPPAPAPVTAAELAQARSNEGLQRAIRLFRLGWRPEAVPEWNFSLRGMNDRQLLAAAEMARQEQIFDRVVNTSLLTRSEVDFSQRFIAPFEGRVTAKAREINLDPAWVYGLIRQESRFITDARSHVGASGLMQLMPATARWVARKLGMKDFSPASVNDFDTNTILGTNYLSMVLAQLGGSQVLATAGYNAGPGRPVQWRSTLSGPVEGAIFAETIPFTETRLYVKHVLSNAVYYSMLFTGQPHSLKQRLGVVAPAPTTRVALP